MVTEEIDELKRRLDILIALTLCQLEHRTEPNDIITVFSRFDIQPREVATILGMTPNAVRIARHRIRSNVRRSRRRTNKTDGR